METSKLILEFVKVLVWPFTTIFILILFRLQLLNLLSRTKRLNLPGGIILETFDQKIEMAKELANEISKENKEKESQHISDREKLKPVTPNYSEANKRMIELGLTPSPSGLEIEYYKELANKDPRLALAGLRIDFELMLNNLAKGFHIEFDNNWSIFKKVQTLLIQDAIDQRQRDFLMIILELSSSAVHGAEISKSQVFEILGISQVLIDDYKSWLHWGFN